MSDLNPRSLLAKPGFTIVEMLIIAPIVILMIGAFVSVIVNLTGEVLASRSANVLAYNTQDALSRIEADVRLSTKFLAVNNVTLTSPQGYDNATGVFQNASAANGNMLILEQPMTAGNPATSAGTALVRAGASLPCSDPNVNSSNFFMTMNVVYFVKIDAVTNISTLWRRTLVPSDYVTASCYTAPVTKPWQQPSCLTGTGGVCLTQDVRLLDGITAANFNVQYFNKASDTIANSVASDPAASDTARNTALLSTATVGVTISVTKTAAGRDVSQTGTIRATRLNGGFVSTAPTNLAAASGPAQVSLSWTAPTDNGGSAIINYKLYRGTTPNPTTLVQTLGNVTTYSDTGLVGGTTYYYRLTATNSTGDSPYSVQATATPTVFVPVNLTFNPTSTGKSGTIQTWTVTVTGTYRITSIGASGGKDGAVVGGQGHGTSMYGEFSLTAGDILYIIVGQQGFINYSNTDGSASGGGGGGASSVTYGGGSLLNSTPLIIAGGGGGGGNSGGAGKDASISIPGIAGWQTAGGTNGSGGVGSYNTGWGGAGAGWLTDGGDGGSYGGIATALKAGGVGGPGFNTTGGQGGFGGGGGGGNNGAGGGGGYSGGGAAGGGGGSYNSGTNQTNTAGARIGQGVVTIQN